MVLKATVVLIAMGLTGSGIAVLTRSITEPQVVTAPPKVVAPAVVTPTSMTFPNEAFERGYQQARFGAQKIFSASR
jgi:hypothetical protein